MEDFSSQKTVDFVRQETLGPERLLSVKQGGREEQRLEARVGGGEAFPILSKGQSIGLHTAHSHSWTLAATGLLRGTDGETIWLRFCRVHGI